MACVKPAGIGIVLVGMLTWSVGSAPDTVQADRPNIVFVLCDDLGYGDVACNNPDGRMATPRIDRLAREGMRLADAHTTSSVCTPTRYGVLKSSAEFSKVETAPLDRQLRSETPETAASQG